MTAAEARRAAKRFRGVFLLNVALAGLVGKRGELETACDMAEAELVRLLLGGASTDTGEPPCTSR